MCAGFAIALQRCHYVRLYLLVRSSRDIEIFPWRVRFDQVPCVDFLSEAMICLIRARLLFAYLCFTDFVLNSSCVAAT